MSSSLIQAKIDDNTIVPLRADINNYLITSSSIIPTNGSFLLGSVNGDLIQADSAPKATVSPDGYRGWYYQNSGGVGRKMNWYFYDGTDRNYFVGDVRLITATIALRHPLNKPFFVLYTKTGSSRVYTSNEIMLDGEKVLFYFGETGYIPQNNENLRLVRCVPTIDNGVVLPSMPVQFLSIHSDSAFPENEFEIVVENLGFRLDNITCNFELLTPATGSSSSNVNVISTVSTPITNSQLDKLTFSLSSALEVNIGSGVSIKNPATSFYGWTEVDFAFYVSGSPIQLGSFSPVVDLSNNMKGFIFWGYGVKTSGSNPHLSLQLSNDGVLWLDTIYNVQVIDADTPFTLVCDFACRYVRLIVRINTIESIYLNMNFK